MYKMALSVHTSIHCFNNPKHVQKSLYSIHLLIELSAVSWSKFGRRIDFKAKKTKLVPGSHCESP